MGEMSPRLLLPGYVPAERVVDYDLKQCQARGDDVHGVLRDVRDRSPAVCYTPRNGGHWLIYGRDNLRKVLLDTDTFSSSRVAVGPDETTMPMIPLQLDPPEHAPYRQLLMRHFGVKEMAVLEPSVRAWAEHLIAPLASASSCDFLKAVAEPLAISVFMQLMGLPLERFDEFRRLALGTLDPQTPPEQARALHLQIYGVIDELIRERSIAPREDLMSRLLADKVNGRRARRDELIAIGFLLFLAGLDTVTNAMAYGVRHLAIDQALQAELRGCRDAIPAAAEELLRRYTFVNPVRVARCDVVLDGAAIKAGDLVCCILWAGSNDESPSDEVASQQFAFGQGAHLCIGRHLARLELKVMYETWFSHIGAFSLAPDHASTVRGGMIMALSGLPLRLEPNA